MQCLNSFEATCKEMARFASPYKSQIKIVIVNNIYTALCHGFHIKVYSLLMHRILGYAGPHSVPTLNLDMTERLLP